MKTKKIGLLLIPTVLSSLLLLQIVLAPKANAIVPLTGPLSGFRLGGQVAYLFHNRLFPIEDVTVWITDTVTHKTYKTKTGEKGWYRITLPADTYAVDPQEKRDFRFWTRTVILNKNQTDIDFTVHAKHKNGKGGNE